MMPTPPGVVWGRWRIEGYLGRGQSGEVYRVREMFNPCRMGALKIYRGAHQMATRDDFITEIDFLEHVRPSCLPGLLDKGEIDHMPYYVMELLETLPGCLSVQRFLPIAIGIIDAVQELHSLRFLHCDIKPMNIAIRPEHNTVCLLDVGSVCSFETLAVSSVRAGTEHYTAPEVRTRGQVSVLSDIYSIGVTLTELCPSELRSIFGSVFAHATATDTRNRTPSLRAFRQELEAALPDFRTRAARVTRLPRYRAVARAAFGTLASLFVMACCFYGWHKYRRYQTRRTELLEKFGTSVDANSQVRTGLVYYQTGDFRKAFWHLERGMNAPDFEAEAFKGIDVRSFYEDCKRRIQEREEQLF